MNRIYLFSIFFLLLVVLVVFTAAPLSVFAQGGKEIPQCPGSKPDPENPKRCVLDNPAPGFLVSFGSFGELLKKIVDILLQFAGAIAVIYLVIGGYQYVVSRGNEEAMEGAKRTVTSAIMGIVIIVLAFALVQIVNNLLTG